MGQGLNKMSSEGKKNPEISNSYLIKAEIRLQSKNIKFSEFDVTLKFSITNFMLYLLEGKRKVKVILGNKHICGTRFLNTFVGSIGESY